MGMVLAACLLALLLRQVDLRQLGMALLEVHVGFLAIGLAIQLAVMWIKSVRWGITIRGATGRPVRQAFSASMIGFAGNVLLPARLGELIRVGVIDKHNQIGWSLALTTVGLTQLFDLLVLVSYFLVVSIWATSLFMAHRWTMIFLGGMVLLMLGILVVLQQRSQPLHAWLLRIRPRLPNVLERRISRYAELFVKGLGVLSKSHMVSQIFLLTIVAWGLETIAAYLMLLAFHISATLLMASILIVVLNLSFAFPITPGNVGITQAVSVFLLSAFGVTKVSALAYSIGSQGTTYLLIVSLGMICFHREGMDLSLFRRAAREGAPGKPTPAVEIQ
ncbi:MAG: lysylphosphatidylglycerol synthase transmembrane domain-containing protein [Candidatus Methylomirabilales bacterium]